MCNVVVPFITEAMHKTSQDTIRQWHVYKTVIASVKLRVKHRVTTQASGEVDVTQLVTNNLVMTKGCEGNPPGATGI